MGSSLGRQTVDGRLRYNISVVALLLSAVLALPASAASSPKAARTTAAKRATRKKRPSLKLRRSRDERLRDARTRGAAVSAPSTPVPRLHLATRPLPEFSKGSTTALATLPAKPKPAFKRPGKATARPKRTEKASAPSGAKTKEKLAAQSFTASRAAPGGVGRVPKEPVAAPVASRAAPKSKSASAKSDARAAKAASGGAPPGGVKSSGGKSGGARKSSKTKGGSNGGAKAPAKAESKGKPTARPYRSDPKPALAAAVPAPPDLPLVAVDGRKRLPEPLAEEPAKEYQHDGARWLPARDGRKLPSLKAGGIWWLYETKPKAVVLRPAFPGMFRGRADDPSIVMFAAKDGSLLVQTYGDRAQASLWKDAAAPAKVASLGEDVADAEFEETRVRIRRRGGETRSFGADGKPLE